MESFASLFEQHSLQLEMREGEVVDAIVVGVDHKYVTVTAGLKSESSIAVSEFKDDLGNVEVKVGDVVTQGQVVGKMGRTGNVRGRTGIHLHFEVIKNGVKQTPSNYY